MNRLKLSPVSSSMLTGVGYDPETKTMQVSFNTKKNGLVSIETYPGVTEAQFSQFMMADSQGKYFLANFKMWPGKFKSHDVIPGELF